MRRSPALTTISTKTSIVHDIQHTHTTHTHTRHAHSQCTYSVLDAEHHYDFYWGTTTPTTNTQQRGEDEGSIS
jgi:hypothetical protein